MIKELIAIQSKLKAPKGQYNSFGKYKYRSAEDILEAVKPLLAEEKCTLTLSDEVLNIGNRFYIKATATLTNSDDVQVINVAYAREDETKKGMDGSQITGTASSYARKYALNGLFLIDDTKDADTDEYHNQTSQPAQRTISQKEMNEAIAEVNAANNREELNAIWGKWVNKYPALNNSSTQFYQATQSKALDIR